MLDNSRVHIETLEKMKEYLILERRRLAENVVYMTNVNGGPDRQDAMPGRSWGAEFQNLQNTIEAVDRAIKGEEGLQPLSIDGMTG